MTAWGDTSRPPVAVGTDVTRRTVPVLPRWSASGSLVLSGTAATAGVGLLGEYVLTPGGTPIRPGWAFGVAVLALALTWWSWWSLRAHRRLRGSLYYLRLQNEAAPDWHEEVVAAARSGYLGFKAVSARLDPGTGVVDVRRQVSAMSLELQRAINDDLDDSGYDLAPNLLFPAALALGFDLLPPADVNLREINGRGRNGQLMPSFEWRLGCATASGQGCAEQSKRRHAGRHFRADAGAGEFVVDAWPKVAKPDPTVTSVWLEICLTESVIQSRYRDRTAVQRTVGVRRTCPTLREESTVLRAEKLDFVASRALPPVQPRALEVAEGVTYWIGQTLRDYPNATVLLAAQAQKTICFAMGYLLSHPYPNKVGHLWQRVVPMGYFTDEPDPLRPMWVRHDQTDPAELLRDAPLLAPGLPAETFSPPPAPVGRHRWWPW